MPEPVKRQLERLPAEWLARRSEAFVPAAARYYKRRLAEAKKK